jgi:hypothetical protein
LEGWLYPTLLGNSVPTDTVVVAGQIGLTESAAGIVILPSGRLAGYVGNDPATNAANLAIAPAPANWHDTLDEWHHLALVYDGAHVTLTVDGVLAAQKAMTGTVAKVTAPFRLGARAEAPGDLTGVLDGRLDNWTLWPTALSPAEIEARRQRGLAEADPVPDLDSVDLYLNFEGAYPSITDGSSKGHVGSVINHGNPGVAGIITSTGRAFRLNHDQIVDAGWQMTAQLTVPQDAPSGMYGVQALLGPNFTPTQTGDKLSVRAIAIRPDSGGPHSPIAVVLPSNTWNAYTHWPENYGPGLVTERSRFPGGNPIRGGNNSAYGEMGDGVSLSYFHGWQRPSNEASPIMPVVNGGYSVRAPNSMYLVRWLDAMGFAYDVYSDDDFDAGVISAANHRVLMPNSHHEYWSDGMLDTLTSFLDDGGSVVAPAGNIFTWRVVYGANRVVEVRKFRKAPVIGIADLQSGVDGAFMGSLRQAALCNSNGSDYYGSPPYKALGVMIHATKPCTNKPFCFGKWAALNTNHWLWQDGGVNDDELFGFGRVPGSFAVGHEADTWVAGMPLPGLAEGQQPTILAEGTDFDAAHPTKGGIAPDGHPALPPASCEDNVMSLIGQEAAGDAVRVPLTRTGTILYFPHTSGGHVLVIGASATPWALASDAALSSLLHRALACFAVDERCPRQVYLPAVLESAP